MMKFGLLTSICEGMTFEEVVNFAAENQLECLEVACWPQGGAQRTYAGVSHIDVANLDEKKAAEIKQLCQEKGVEISSLAYYPNTLEPDEKKRNSYISHLYKLMDASVLLGVNMITTFIGRDSKKNVDENMELVKEVWTPIVRYAEEKGVRIAIENCPMLFTNDEWPGGQNIMSTPQTGGEYLRFWTAPIWELIMILPTLYGSRLIISSQFMNLRIRFSMYITRISRYSGISWQMWV